MASSSSSSSSERKELEIELRNGGNKLLMPPSSVDELLNLLDKQENSLNKVEQAPSQSMLDAVVPLMKALIASELLLHPDIDVKISVLSCISEVMRITAPDPPYNDDQMKGIFRLTVMAFEKLSNMSGRCYTKAVSILHTLGQVRSCLVMLDLECDELIIQMFKHFLRTIRSNHPEQVFSDMAIVMTLVLEESEEISMELLIPLLTSVKNENQKVSPVSWKLGEKVIRNCAAKLKPYLREAGKAMGIGLSDFAEVVVSICRDAGEGENLVVGALVPDTISPKKIGQSVDESFKSVISDWTSQERSNDTHSLGILEHGCQTKQGEGTYAGVEAQPENLDPLKSIKPEAEPLVLPKKRGRKPNSLLKPEEGYDHSWVTLQTKSVELQRCKKNGDKKIGTSSFTLPASEDSSLLPEPENVPKGSLLGAKSDGKASPNADATLKKKSEGRRYSKTKSEMRSSTNALAAKTKERISSLDNVVKKKNDGVPSHLEGEQESVLRQIVGKKKRRGKVTSEKHVPEESGGSFLAGSNRTSSHPNQKASIVNRDVVLNLLSVSKGDLPSAQIDKKASNCANVYLKKKSEGTRKKKSEGTRDFKTKHGRSSSDNVLPAKSKKETVIFLDDVVEVKQSEVPSELETLIQQMDSNKRSWGEMTSDKHVSEESRDKKIGRSITKPLTKDDSYKVSKKSCKRKITPRKDEVSEMLPGFKDYGEEMVGCSIRVWWPMDQVFYEGLIDSFDPLEKKHKVLYVDGDEETLNLCWERWELLGMNILPDRRQKKDVSSPDAIFVMPQEKARMKSKTSTDQEKMDYSSKRGGASASRSNLKAPKSGSKPTEDPVTDTLKVAHKLGGDASETHGKLNIGKNFTSMSKVETPMTILRSKRGSSKTITKCESSRVGPPK